MAAGESNVVAACLLRAPQIGCVLGKNVRGMFLTLGKHARKMKAGWLIPSSPDLVGHHSIIVTPDMVGARIAVAMYIEVKTEDGVIAIEQQAFIDKALAAGAIAGVARSPDDMESILQKSLARWRGIV